MHSRRCTKADANHMQMALRTRSPYLPSLVHNTERETVASADDSPKASKCPETMDIIRCPGRRRSNRAGCSGRPKRRQGDDDTLGERPSFAEYQDGVKQDLRSCSVPYKRDASDGYRYWNFKVVKRGDIGQKYLTAPEHTLDCPLDCKYRHPLWNYTLPANAKERKVATWTKRSLYQEAQELPRPPKHHRSCRDAKNSCSWRRNQDCKEDAEYLSRMDPGTLRQVSPGLYDDICDDIKFGGRFEEDYYWFQDNSGEVMSGTPDLIMEVRNYEVSDHIVQRALDRWKEGCKRADDLYLEESWEAISHTSSFEVLTDIGEFEDDEEWVEA